MAIVTRHKFDGTLPPCALYLDDIERILEILKSKTPELYKPKLEGPLIAGVLQPEPFKFKVGNVECETIAEWQKLGESKHELHIRADWCDLDLDSSRATWRSRGQNIEQEVYGLLLPIFNSRQRPVPMLWGLSKLYYLIQSVAIVLLPVAGGVIGFSTKFWGHIVVGSGIWLLGMLAMFKFNRFNLPYSTIYLRRSRDPIPESSRWLPKGPELVRLFATNLVTALASGAVSWFFATHLK